MNKQNNDWYDRLNKGTENFEKLTNVNIMAGYYSWIESFIEDLLKEQQLDVYEKVERLIVKKPCDYPVNDFIDKLRKSIELEKNNL